MIVDECFNAAFIYSPYVAGSYIFGAGNVIAAIGNTVNVKQDIWSDELLCLIAQ